MDMRTLSLQSISQRTTASRGSLPRWVWIGLSLVGIGLLGLLVPSQYEGAVLIPISPRHELSLLDAVALILLILGTGIVY